MVCVRLDAQSWQTSKSFFNQSVLKGGKFEPASTQPSLCCFLNFVRFYRERKPRKGVSESLSRICDISTAAHPASKTLPHTDHQRTFREQKWPTSTMRKCFAISEQRGGRKRELDFLGYKILGGTISVLFILCPSCFRLKPYGSDSDDSGDEGTDFDVDKLEPLEVGPGEHKLQYTYCLWFGKKGSHRAAVSWGSEYFGSEAKWGFFFWFACRNTRNRSTLWVVVPASSSGGRSTAIS